MPSPVRSTRRRTSPAMSVGVRPLVEISSQPSRSRSNIAMWAGMSATGTVGSPRSRRRPLRPWMITRAQAAADIATGMNAVGSLECGNLPRVRDRPLQLGLARTFEVYAHRRSNHGCRVSAGWPGFRRSVAAHPPPISAQAWIRSPTGKPDVDPAVDLVGEVGNRPGDVGDRLSVMRL
jgi:hypothetical protein